MMRLQTYAPISFAGTLAIIYHAFSTRAQFYPAMVYLSTSKISLALLLNMGGVIMYTLWKLIGRFFLGPLREAELERLNEQTWREVMEILFTVTIFRQDLSLTFFVMVTTLLAIKTLHWLAQKRVEYIETTPAVTALSHIRIVSFLGFLLCLDSLFLYSALRNLVTAWKSSVSLFFAFEYMILATTTVATFVKYVFYVTDMLMEGEWEKRPVFTFYLELIRDLVHLSLYICFFLVIFMNYGVPLHLIRELYETFRNFKARIGDYLRYRKITSNMNDRFPDATPEELNTSDATCIICREEMVTAKKLVCGHLFHVHCLRSWLERQHTCPTCRAPVIPPENGTAAPGRHGVRSAAHQQGTNTNNASSQSSTSSAPTDGLSQHHTRLQAAAAAAAVYQKSYVYPSASSYGWSQGHALLPPTHGASPDSANVGLTGEREVSGNTNFVFPQVPYFSSSSQATGTNLTHVDKLSSDPERPVSQLEAQKILIRNQIEGVVYWQPPKQALEKVTAMVWDPSTSCYGADEGLPELREALRKKVNEENKLYKSSIMVTAGANQAFVNLVLALCDAGDSVVMFAPYYFNSYTSFQMTGITNILVGPGDPKTLQPDADWLEKVLSNDPVPKVVNIVNPGNPSGTYIPDPLLKRISDLCKCAGSWLIVDNTYDYFMYDGLKHSCIEGDHIVNIFSFSKAYGMMGWRVGYIAYPSEVEGLGAQLLKVQDNIPICASILSQRLALYSLESGSEWVREQVKDLVKNREILREALSPLGKDAVKGGEGAIYLWAKLPDKYPDDCEVVRWLAQRHGIVVIPGSASGGPGCIRISFGGLKEPDCEVAAGRLRKGLEELVRDGMVQES